MENYPSVEERFVFGLLYEVTGALDVAGMLVLSSLLTSFVHNMCKSAGFIHIRTTIPTPLVPLGGFPTMYPFPSSFPSFLSLTISVASQRRKIIFNCKATRHHIGEVTQVVQPSGCWFPILHFASPLLQSLSHSVRPARSLLSSKPIWGKTVAVSGGSGKKRTFVICLIRLEVV